MRERERSYAPYISLPCILCSWNNWKIRQNTLWDICSQWFTCFLAGPGAFILPGNFKLCVDHPAVKTVLGHKFLRTCQAAKPSRTAPVKQNYWRLESLLTCQESFVSWIAWIVARLRWGSLSRSIFTTQVPPKKVSGSPWTPCSCWVCSPAKTVVQVTYAATSMNPGISICRFPCPVGDAAIP